MAMVHFSYQANIQGYGPVIAFSFWHLALYIFNRFTDMQEDSRNTPSEALDQKQARLSLFLTGFLLLAGIITLYISEKTLIYYILSVPFAFLYGLKIPFIRYRIKDITYVKTAYAVFFCWCLPVIFIALTYSENIQQYQDLTKFLFLLFFFTTCYELLADIKDIPGDTEYSVNTIAVKYGEKATRIMVILLIAIALFISNLIYPFISYSFSMLIIIFSFLVRPNKPAFYFHALIFITTAAVMIYYFINVWPKMSGFFI